MATIKYPNLKRDIAQGFKNSPNSDRLRTAHRNALRKSTALNEALYRKFISDTIKMERSFRAKDAKQKAAQMLKAFNNSKQKFGFNEAFERKVAVDNLRMGREFDADREWGVSFKARLNKTNWFYRPVNLNNLITKYLRESKLKKAVVVEIGAGIGNTASDLKQSFGGKIQHTATGLLWLPEWKKQMNGTSINWKLAHADNLKKVAKPNSVDIIHSNLGLQHSTNRERALHEAHRLLKKGGLLLFTSEKEFFPQGVPNNFELVTNTINKTRTGHKKRDWFVYILKKK